MSNSLTARSQESLNMRGSEACEECMGDKAARQGSEACEAEIPNPNKKANCRLTEVPFRLTGMACVLRCLALCNDPIKACPNAQKIMFLTLLIKP